MKYKFNPSIKTVGFNRHLWSLSLSGKIGVIAEGEAKTLSGAMRAIREAKKKVKK